MPPISVVHPSYLPEYIGRANERAIGELFQTISQIKQMRLQRNLRGDLMTIQTKANAATEMISQAPEEAQEALYEQLRRNTQNSILGILQKYQQPAGEQYPSGARGVLQRIGDRFNPFTTRGTQLAPTELEGAIMGRMVQEYFPTSLEQTREQIYKQEIKTPEQIESEKRMRQARVTGAEEDVSPKRLAEKKTERRLAREAQTINIQRSQQLLSNSELDYKAKQQDLRVATDPKTRKLAKLKLETARYNLDFAKLKLENEKKGLSGKNIKIDYWVDGRKGSVRVPEEKYNEQVEKIISKGGRLSNVKPSYDIKEINEYLRSVQYTDKDEPREIRPSDLTVVRQLLKDHPGWKLKKVDRIAHEAVDRQWPLSNIPAKKGPMWVLEGPGGETAEDEPTGLPSKAMQLQSAPDPQLGPYWNKLDDESKRQLWQIYQDPEKLNIALQRLQQQYGNVR